MNKITIELLWQSENLSMVMEKGKLIVDCLKVNVERIPVFKNGEQLINFDQNAGIVTSIIGYISNLEELCTKYSLSDKEDAAVLSKLFSRFGTGFFGELSGLFSAFIWDVNAKKGYFFQDQFGSNIPVYYCEDSDSICISSSLKEIIRRKKESGRTLNFDAVKDFLISKNIIPNKQTFIKDIYKLTPGKYLLMEKRNREVKIRSIKYLKEKISIDIAKENLMKQIKLNILSLNNQIESDNKTCTLSGGYDSNAILYFLSPESKNITAFTIGGSKRSEIANATQLAKFYDNVCHNSAVVKETQLGSFPDIVWRTEGYVCESGLFLQYELANLLKDKTTQLFCGEAADQIMDQCRKRTELKILKRDARKLFSYFIFSSIWPEFFRESRLSKYCRRPSLKINYDIELDYILKKNGIMLNSFGIQPLCPFVDRKLAAMSTALGELNKSKSFYKNELKKVLGEKKMAFINKAGGATDVEYLFKGYDAVVLELLNDPIFCKAYGKKRLQYMLENQTKNSELIIRLLFVYVFKELYVSGNYDHMLQNNSINIGLKDLFFKDILDIKDKIAQTA